MRLPTATVPVDAPAATGWHARLALRFGHAQGRTTLTRRDHVGPLVVQKDIERAIRTLPSAGEMAILLVEQYYDFARALADQYVVLSRGEVVKAGRGADMDAHNVRALLAV